MEAKYLIGIFVVIVAIGGATACTFLLPLGNTQKTVKSDPTPAVTAPAAGNDSSNAEQTQTSTQKTVQAQKETCTQCGGKGYVKCSACSGTGLLKGSCATCGGDGKVYYDQNGVCHPNVIQLVAVLACHEDTCPTCGGTGGAKSTCTSCGGDGKIVCSKCGGDGYI